jgi:hypothetical protein
MPWIDSLIDLSEIIRGSFVYFLFHDKEVVYVGKSETIGARLAVHAKNKTFTGAGALRVKPKDWHALEIALIRVIQPKYNVQGKGHPFPDDIAIIERYGIDVHSIAPPERLKMFSPGICNPGEGGM